MKPHDVLRAEGELNTSEEHILKGPVLRNVVRSVPKDHSLLSAIH